MNYSKESLERIQKVKKMKESGIIPYANKFDKKENLKELQNLDEKNNSNIDDLMENGAKNKFSTAGRLMIYRTHGKLAFAKIKDFSGEIQIAFVKNLFKFNTGNKIVENVQYDGNEVSAHKFIEKQIDIGDFIGVKGELFLTKHGEKTLFVNEAQLLSKAIRPLPEKFHGIQDQDSIYRQRYLDMTMNNKSYENALLRTDLLKSIRNFYWKNNFIEVETPVLGNSASGAAAQPFITHHNDFDEDFYLRISPETALKKATAGRFERIFEVSRNFRNEGSDPTHMQEFTAIEHYCAWWNFEDNMDFTEKMFENIFKDLGISKKINVKDKDLNGKIVDFGKKFERIDYIEGVKKESGIDISNFGVNDEEELRKLIKEKGINFEGMEIMATATLIDYLYKKVLRPKILGPAFVYNYPKTMQPLARQNDENPGIVEQFQMVVNGQEILKAYSELVDPFIQRENFEEQGSAIERGDEEATSGDDDFLLAMEHGIPCQSGWGMGIDRLVSILTEQDNLRDTILFPLMKPLNGDNSTGKSKETKIAVVILNKEIGMESWQEMNTIAHLNASFASRKGKGLLMQDNIETKDGEKISLNIQHAIMIKESKTGSEILELIKNSKENGLEISEFTKEMIATTDDKKVEENTRQKNWKDIKYLGVLVFGNKKEVEKLTNKFELYSGNNSPKKETENINNFTEIPSREKILKMAGKYSTSTKQHILQVGDIMETFAEKLGEDTHYWWTIGVLHDIDWDFIEKDGDKHCQEEFIKMCNEFEIPDFIIKDIQSHVSVFNPEIEEKPDTLVRKYLSSVDELSGFIWAYFRMLPSENIMDVKPKSIKKKIKDKSFAAGVDRIEVKNCETLLNIEIDEFIEDIKIGLSKGKWSK